MSTITRIACTIADDLTAEICQEVFRNGKERFVVYFCEGDFEYTEGVFKTEEQARVCYDKLVQAMRDGWRP